MLSKEKKGATYRTRFYLWMRTKLRKRSAVVLYLLLGIGARQRDKLNV